MKTYTVKKIEPTYLLPTGKCDHALWDKAVVLKEFSSPWHFEDIEDIEFRALHDGEHLFVSYKVSDTSVHIDSTDNSKKSVDNSDRVELFMRSDSSMDPYYCLEIDPLGRVQDFMARPDKNFDFGWDWPLEDICIKADITETYFTVEVVLSFDALRRYHLLNKNTIEAGIFRAKYHQQSNGQFTPTWITWVDPQTETPNFHTPSAFGQLRLEGL